MNSLNLPQSWLADRTSYFNTSGIRRIFDLAATMTDPVDLSIGQPHFDVPEVIQDAAIEAINEGKNGYAPSAGIRPLREKLQTKVDREFGHLDRQVMVTSGTSGAIVLAMMALVNPGDEIILFDPCFLMYQPLVQSMGGTAVLIDTYPDFDIDVTKIEAAITDRTKLILLNSPNNPTGHTVSAGRIQAVAELAEQRGIVLLSDEIYKNFSYDDRFRSPTEFNTKTIVVDGFSKTYGITGWRVGWVHGPGEIIDAMARIQPYTFVCAPQPAQWAAIRALDVDMSHPTQEYHRKRNHLIESLDPYYSFSPPGGAFYLFPQVPRGDATDFVARAIEQNLLIIPGGVFSQRNTHFRISFAVSDSTLERGIEILKRLA